MRPERRHSGRNDGAALAALPATFWRKSDKSQGFGDRVPKVECACFRLLQSGPWNNLRSELWFVNWNRWSRGDPEAIRIAKRDLLCLAVVRVSIDVKVEL
jgi:hypothetical protein